MGSPGILREIQLQPAQVKLLEFIAERGGEIPWNWDNCRPDVHLMVRQMIDQKQVLEEVSGPDARISGIRVRLTQAGRDAVEQVQRGQARLTYRG